MSGIDKIAYRSKLAGLKAGSKLLFSLCLMILCLFFNSFLISSLTIITMSAATLIWGGCRLKKYLELLVIPLTFLLTGIITIVISRVADREAAIVSIQIFGSLYGISSLSLLFGLRIFLKAFGTVTCLYFFSLNTPMNSFLSLLRRKVPGVFVELMELIYRFVFIVWEEAGKIRTAQSSRLGYKGFKNSMNSLGELITTVFIRAFRRVDRVNAALLSRGFEGNFDVLTEEEQSSRLLVGCTIATTVVFIVIGILERLWK